MEKKEDENIKRKYEAIYYTLADPNLIKAYAKNEDGTLKRLTYQLPKEFSRFKQDELDYFVEKYNNNINEKNIDKEKLRELYFRIVKQYSKWMDLKDEYKNIASLWIIGTWFHEQFNTFPLLFINAMRGSGKSRFLNLSSNITKNGIYIHSNLTEAVAFRTTGTLLIDEFESINSKEKQTLRELLNSCYKKGSKVYRMKEKKGVDGKDYEAQSFNTYRPVAIANIWGMDEVLTDRCITLILEKSSDTSKTCLIENFEFDEEIQNIKFAFLSLECSLCSVVSLKRWCHLWNKFVEYTTPYTNNTNYTNYIDEEKISVNQIKEYTTPYTNNTNYTNYIDEEMHTFFNKIYQNNITGRNLELFIPLFFIAKIIGNDILDYTIINASKIVHEKKQDEEMESKDVMLYDFISKYDTNLEYIQIKVLTQQFKNYIGSSEEWLNDKWLGRAMKRLNLITEKRRVCNGIEIIPNTIKAKEKLKIFKTNN